MISINSSAEIIKSRICFSILPHCHLFLLCCSRLCLTFCGRCSTFSFAHILCISFGKYNMSQNNRVENPNKCMIFSEKLSVVICFAIYLNNFCLHFLVTFFQHLFSCYFESTLSICKSAYYNLILFSCNYFSAACVCEYIMSCGSCWRAKCSGHIRKVGGCCVISRKVRAT